MSRIYLIFLGKARVRRRAAMLMVTCFLHSKGMKIDNLIRFIFRQEWKMKILNGIARRQISL